MKNLLRISQVAEKTGVTPRTIRFYVHEGLIPEPVQARRNMALYHPDAIGQIRAIKQAQSQRFLPLVVIRRILEKNGYDYASLDTGETGQNTKKEPGIGKHGDEILKTIPENMLRVLEAREWVQRQQGKTGDFKYGQANEPLIRLLGILNRYGAPWEDLVTALAAIEDRVRETVELELKSLTGWALKNPADEFPEIQELARDAVRHFITHARKHHLARAVNRHKEDLDYTFQASADEGFALPPECLGPELKAMENQLIPRKPSPRILNDLALGYSCIGQMDTALKYLRRIRRSHPEDLETKVRWTWYRRFSSGKKGASRIKPKMQALVDEHPEYALGRAFLGIWHMFDSLEADDPQDSLRLANLCLNEFAGAQAHLPIDPHQQTLIRYAKSRVLMSMPNGADHIENSLGSFYMLLNKKSELDAYYAAHLPFFPKWLWPNLYYFTGMAHTRAGQYDQAVKLFKKGSSHHMLPPFRDHIEAGIQTAETAAKQTIQGGRHDAETVLEPGDGDPIP